MKFSIIIINYQTPELTDQCLRSLEALPNQNEREIILIDNASPDNSVDYLESRWQNKITFIKNETNLGFAGANNQGARQAKGEYLLFLNSDTIINNDIFSRSEEIFNHHPNIAALSPRLKLETGQWQKSAFGKFPTIARLIRQSTKKDPAVAKDQELMTTDWISGCALIIRRADFIALNGWDENFFLYFEDVDLCRRLKKKKRQVAVDLKSSIIHLGGRSLDLKKNRRSFYFQSQDYYFAKHHGKLAKLIIQLLRFFYLKMQKQ